MSDLKKPRARNARAGTSSTDNWLAPQKTVTVDVSTQNAEKMRGPSRKKRKLEHSEPSTMGPKDEDSTSKAAFSREVEPQRKENRDSIPTLRQMVLGQVQYTPHQHLPGKYIALDCEMVGVGIDGTESSLARVSLVNFHGVVLLDEFVRQRERVVDYRTQFSGVRERDMIKAKPFDHIQKRVSELLQDRILIGHAVSNDLKALLLSHPWLQTRDTQYYAGKYKVATSNRVALRKLVEQELGLIIQCGEHSSVTDARAAMAVYRLHRTEWEKGSKYPGWRDHQVTKKKRKKSDSGGNEAELESESNGFPGGGTKGVSSGLSTVVVRRGESKSKGTNKWWKELGVGSSKGSIQLHAK